MTRIFAFQVLLSSEVTGLSVDGKAQCEQVRAVSIERLGPVIGRLPASLMTPIDAALRVHLSL